MFNRFTLSVGARYALSRGSSHLVSFISRMSVGGLVISVALLIMVLSVMNGFDRELRQQILQLMPQGTIYNRDGIENPRAIMAQIQSHPQVTAAAPFVNLEGLLNARGNVVPVQTYGVEPELEQAASNVGRFLRNNRLMALADNPRAVILGAALAANLNADVGSQITFIVPRGEARGSPNTMALTVVDIFDSGTEVDQHLALMNIVAASKMTAHPGKVSGIRFNVKDLFSAGQTVLEISSQLPMGYYGRDWMRTHGDVYQAIHMSKKLVALLLLLLIGIAAFNLIATLVMVVVDKQSDIAILRTQGARARDIVGIFIVQGAIIGGVGTVLGAIVGVLLSHGVTAGVAGLESILGMQFMHSDVYPVSYMPSQVLWSDVAYICGSALVLSVLASIYPALKAARILPAEALRHE
ncbi:lipoprotein-releasing ABC transporter permease subunit [Gilvimarinus sp. SDUM040013]|uniref:Lipoprotein-releasing ABC transporter permease subunit n=1 Tax=Gilvimarinus gilvus TaxID=3058038 RepID=A0ABU4S1D4_9GAMM|nr:lipoprotein-releasing ABC transporter permease subunit [Gilvimarinus sp. SDUM040013]MDO3387154.1 lipoprotein-releasing ABC transporter permease subunit [Gilvimarinus sp. SDUM040013]MDX6850897.1 lipoprotein-releasing ABC transporter permease subunit [Gilvimarinus sp. SDUM040013]